MYKFLSLPKIDTISFKILKEVAINILYLKIANFAASVMRQDSDELIHLSARLPLPTGNARFLTLIFDYISQGSVETRLRCGVVLNANYSENVPLK